MSEHHRLKMIPFVKKIDQIIRKTGYDKTFVTAAQHHLKVMFEKDGDNLNKRGELCYLLMTKLFIDKLDLYPTQRFKCQVNEHSGWPVPVLPSEVFGETKPPDDMRRKRFYKSLKVSDILECRVASVLPTEYKLRVIHKYGITRILDDLNLIVGMPHKKAEMDILQTELLTRELIRVAVFEINADEISVTVDPKKVVFTRTIPELGRITENELPPYVLDPPESEKYSSYSEYLSSMPQFRNPTFLNSIYSGFGVNPLAIHTFFPQYDRLKFSDDFSGETLLNESRTSDALNYLPSIRIRSAQAENYAFEAIKELKKDEYDNALYLIKTALDICPKTENLMAKLYEVRSDIRAAIAKHKPNTNNRLSFLDLELAYAVDNKNEEIGKKLSKVLFKASNKFMKKKQYKKAAVCLERALKVDENNIYVKTLLKHIQTKHAEDLLNFDEESLYTLEEKKKEIVTILKKIQS